MDTTVSSQAQPSVDKERARMRALATLRQGVWEASQFLAFAEIHEYVDDVIAEIVRDEP